MTKISLTVLLALILGALKAPDNGQRAEQGGEGQDSGIQFLISQLWSPDDAVRDSAKAKLVKTGPAAGPYLISLIETVADHPDQHRFATGKEREGALYWEDAVATQIWPNS